MTNPLVSVIVPTRNNAATLHDCLRSIDNQTYGNIELLVVDNNSTDNTLEIAKVYTTHVYVMGPERSAQRNFGASTATGEYVCMIDSDMTLAPTVIAECVERATNPEVLSVVVPEESIGQGFWAQCKRLERSFYVGVDWMEAARFFKRQTFLDVGGYNVELVSGEDWDLAQRIGNLGMTERIGAFISHNEGQLRLGETLRKKYYYAQQFAKYLEANKNTQQAQSQAGIVARYGLFLKQPGRLFRRPHLGLGVLFMKTAEFGVGGMGYLLSKRSRTRAMESGE
jgi:glycosyltransferase involved in cell wall biosynthesis